MTRMPLLTGALLALGAPVSASPLTRSVSLGVEIRPTPPGQAPGVLVTGLRSDRGVPLRVNDVIVSVNNVPVRDVPTLQARLRTLRVGTRFEIGVMRSGARTRLRGVATGRPHEVFAGGETRLGEVSFGGGALRDFMVTQRGGPIGPVVFLLQGYTCASVETASADASHYQLIQGLLARGISTYRIEKPATGDSRGGTPCSDIDFATELAAFRAGYAALIEKYGIPPNRIYLFGHSLGGIIAPLLAAEARPRGVAVYGTVFENWQDYMFQVVRVQDFLARNADPAAGEAAAESIRALHHQIFVERLTPTQIVERDPGAGALLRTFLKWDGGVHYYGRHYAYWQGLARQRMTAAWRDVHAPVLAIYGESDVEALDARGHRAIVDVVNHYRPATARFVSVPRTGHGMRIDGAVTEIRRNPARAATAPFNPSLVDVVADWIAANPPN